MMRRNYGLWWMFLSVLMIASTILYGQQNNKKGERRNQGRTDDKEESVFYTSIPKHDFDIILGRVTDHSITISVMFYQAAKTYLTIREQGTTKLDTIDFTINVMEPKEIVLDKLKSDIGYQYQLCYRTKENKVFIKSEWYYFHTQRSKGESYSFTITADSHLDQNADTATYKRTLKIASTDSADFHIDLGDTFMTDKYRENFKDALSQYLAQRYYLGLLCQSSPLFFVQGNHDGEAGQRLNGKNDNMTVWSNLTRKKYFPNPFDNGFYKGNHTQEPFVGFPENYYAWEWGDALFVVLDPFWYTPLSGQDNPWDRTLGKTQYDWLRETLEKSSAKFKFVFIHNLVGGADIKGKARGGAEVAGLYEWGGKNSDGSDGFKQHRADWEMPIQELLVKNKVSVVFHGHDHLFAKQEKDGIIYQCLPQPGSKDFGNNCQGEEYGYKSGTILNGPGYLKVTTSPSLVRIDYIGSKQGAKESKETYYTYTIK